MTLCVVTGVIGDAVCGDRCDGDAVCGTDVIVMLCVFAAVVIFGD